MKTNSDLRNTERVPFGTTQKRRSLRKGLENIKAHLKLSFVRDKYIPLKREKKNASSLKYMEIIPMK